MTWAPATNGASGDHIYIAARGVDNNDNPNENDGKIFEIAFSGGSSDSTPPTVEITEPADTATVSGTSVSVPMNAR